MTNNVISIPCAMKTPKKNQLPLLPDFDKLTQNEYIILFEK